MVTYDFSGRNVIVTGGTRGIGGAISAAFLAAGAHVTALYAGNDTCARAFSAEHDTEGRLVVRRLDISVYADVEVFFREYAADRQKLDILVNNAGIRRDSVVGMMPETDWRRVLDVNLTGCYNMAKFAVQNMMSQRYGRIIGITSPSGELGFEGQANYAASKAGLVAFSKSLSKEVAKRRITVNCVSPGFIDTDFISGLPQDQLNAYKASVPMKRFGTADEVARAVLFLAGEEASYITGTVLDVTGGL